MGAVAHTWSAGDGLQGSLLSYHPVDLRDQTQVTSLDDQQLYLLSHPLTLYPQGVIADPARDLSLLWLGASVSGGFTITPPGVTPNTTESGTCRKQQVAKCSRPGSRVSAHKARPIRSPPLGEEPGIWEHPKQCFRVGCWHPIDSRLTKGTGSRILSALLRKWP